MQFTSLSRSLLVDLKCKGYNLLATYDAINMSNPTWQPLRIRNVQEYLLQLKYNGSNIDLKKPAVLIIDQALNLLEDNQLSGDVLIEDDHAQRLQQKCKLYDLRYHFTTNPEIYDFSFDPQRVLIRNHALRTGDHDIYFNYLQMYYQEHVSYEMKDMEVLTESLMCLDAKQAQQWFERRQVTVVESDIWICDQDAILKVLDVKEHHHRWECLDHADEMIYNVISVQEVLLLRDLFWIDSRIM